MAESVNSHLDGRQLDAGPIRLPEWVTPVLLGLAGGVAAALFVTAYWTIAIAAALFVLALSVAEYEPFFLMVIFLLPLSWARSAGAIHDVMTPIRLLMLFGFFAGRLWRGELDLSRAWASPISRASVLFCAVVLGTIVIGPVGWTHDSLAQIYRLVSWVGFYFFALTWIDSPRRLRKVLAALLGSLCLLGLFSLVQEVVGGYTSLWLYLNPPGPDFNVWTGRAPSLIYYPTALAGYLDLGLPFALGCWVAGKGRLKALAGWALGLGFISLLFSQSLGGLLAFGSVLGLAIYFFARTPRRRALALVGLVAVGLGFYLTRHTLNPAHFADVAKSLPPDVIIRLLQFHAAWVLFLRHPILGVGFGNFGAASGALLPNVSWMPSTSLMASNLYLNVLAETGILGFAVFLYLFFLIGRKALRDLRRAGGCGLGLILGFGALGAVSTLLVHGLVDYLFSSPQYGTLLFLEMALLVTSSKILPTRKRSGPDVGVNPGGKSLGLECD